MGFMYMFRCHRSLLDSARLLFHVHFERRVCCHFFLDEWKFARHFAARRKMCGGNATQNLSIFYKY